MNKRLYRDIVQGANQQFKNEINTKIVKFYKISLFARFANKLTEYYTVESFWDNFIFFK